MIESVVKYLENRGSLSRTPCPVKSIVLVLSAWFAFLPAAFSTDTIVTNQLGQGIVYRHYHYDSLDGGKQEVYLTDINLNDPAVSLKVSYLNSGRTVSAHAATISGAAVAVNGQFFVSTGAIDCLKVHGAIIYNSQPNVHDEQAITDDGLGHTNSISIALRPGAINSWTNLAISNIISCGVNMIQNGVKVTNYDFTDPYIIDSDPRTCAAWTYDNHLLLMVVDGESTSALGMTIPQLRDDLFARAAIRHAFSFDGGGSSDMWARGIGVCNHPSDGFERDVADAVVMVAPVPAIPAAPLQFTATPGTNTISLAWNLASGAMTYNIKRSLTNGGSYATIASSATTTYSDTNLAANITYYYVVSAVNMIGEGSNSAQAAATILSPPLPPTNLVAVAGNAQITLTWSPTTNATRYDVKLSTTNGGPYITVANTPVTKYTGTLLNNGTPYYYVVSAVNTYGEGAQSVQIAVTPLAPLAAPALAFGISGTTLTVTSPSQAGRTYQLQITASLQPPVVWSNFGSPLAGSGTNLTFHRPANVPSLFLRVQVH